MKKIVRLIIIILSINMTAQVGVGISNPNTSAMLDVNSTAKGFLPPRLTTVQRDAVNGGNPSAGLIIYNLDLHCLEYFNGTRWISFCDISQVNYRIGGSLDDDATAFEKTSDGGYIIGGQSISSVSGDITATNHGDGDYWIMKFDASGHIEWDKLYGGSAQDILSSIKETSDGGYIAVGQTLSSASGNITGTSHGGTDIWVIKLNSSGDIDWQRLYGGNGDDFYGAVQQTPDGGYIIAGETTSSSSGDVSGSLIGIGDSWIVKTDNLGNIQWDKRYGAALQDTQTRCIVQTSDGYVVGTFSEHPWVYKLDTSGNMVWQHTYAGNDYESLTDLEKTSDGGFIFSGASGSSASGDVSGVNHGGYDYWIVKLNSSGNIEWDKLIGGSENDLPAAIQQAADGGYVVMGQSWGSAGTGDVSGPAKGFIDAWAVKLNSSGTIEWNKTLGGIDYNFGQNVQQTPQGGYIFTVFSGPGSAGTGDQTGLIGRGESDLWLVYLDANGNLIP